MNCPECNVPLKKFPIGDDELKECPICRGLWFEKGQLDSVKDEVLPEMGWMDIDKLKKQFEFLAKQNTLQCPECPNKTLTKIHDQNTKTEFCICSQCKGTWLATGQFLSFINLLLEEADKKSSSELAIISLRQAKKLLTDPGLSISEWHDFKSVLSLLKHRIFIENPKLQKVIVGLEKSLPL